MFEADQKNKTSAHEKAVKFHRRGNFTKIKVNHMILNEMNSLPGLKTAQISAAKNSDKVIPCARANTSRLL